MQPGVTPGALLEFHAARAHLGISPGHNESAETQLFDTSGNARHGTLTNCGFTTASGYGGAGSILDPYHLATDGANDRVDTAAFAQASGEWTIEAWVRYDGGDISTNTRHLITHGATGVDGFRIYVSTDNTTLTARCIRAGAAQSVNLTGTPLTVGAWRHIAFVCSNAGATGTWYLDGAAQAPVALTDPMLPPTSRVFRLANYDTGTNYAWPGKFAAVRYYAYCLTAPQVTANYAAGTSWPIDLNAASPKLTRPTFRPTIKCTMPPMTINGQWLANDARFNSPTGLAFDSAGNLFVADQSNNCIRKITPTGVVTTFAGTTGTTSGHVDDTGTAARFNNPAGLAFDSSGDLFVADYSNHCIRKITPSGVVTTFAGTTGTTSGHVDDTGTAARFYSPANLTFDASGDLFVADSANHCIRKITPAGVVTTFVGTTGTTSGHVDDTGTAARFNYPWSLAFDNAGDLFVADALNDCIRKITPAGVVTTFVGTTGTTSGLVDDIGTNSRFYRPRSLALDSLGNIFVADAWNNNIRKITPAGVVTTFAGNIHWGPSYSGHVDSIGTSARFYVPYGLSFDASGRLFIADSGNNCIRKITTTSAVTTPYGTKYKEAGHVDIGVENSGISSSSVSLILEPK
ncbi:MAG: LamG-like jellyroll fold domain-containing protein [Candidatus Paceibacterota bacterium]|jgi:hypothetical protein